MIASSHTHFIGIVIRLYNQFKPSIEAALTANNAVDVAHSGDNKIVAVIEALSEKELANQMQSISDLQGVISVSLAYHQIEETATLNDVTSAS